MPGFQFIQTSGLNSQVGVGISTIIGATGPLGMTGPQGLQGPSGFSTNTGAQGYQGPQGLRGATGASLTGPQGISGSLGATGASLTGPQGAQGPAGGGGSGGVSSQWNNNGLLIYYNSGPVVLGNFSTGGNATGALHVFGNINQTGTFNIVGNINQTGTLLNSTFQRYAENIFIGNVSGSYTINCQTGNNFALTLTSASNTLSVINPPSTGALYNLTLFITQDSTGNRTVTWPGTFSWGNPSTPVLSTSANAIDIISAITYTGGSKWIASLAGRGF
jgi:hypothetical protein